jgi:hypothetical protein
MRIVVAHLTRMQRGTVCVAGIDVETGQQVRPVPPMSVLLSRVIAPRGGAFDMATVVDLGLTRPIPSAPELEDHEFTWWHARSIRQVEPDLFWPMLRHVARPSLREIFGPGLRPIGKAGSRRAVTDLGTGNASLGILMPHGQPRLTLSTKPDGRASVRISLSDDDFALDLGVTDLRLYADDGGRPDSARVYAVADRLARGVPALLSVGLTRPFSSRDDEAPVHWLQVNNIHLEDDPCWRLPPGPPVAQSHMTTSVVGRREAVAATSRNPRLSVTLYEPF